MDHRRRNMAQRDRHRAQLGVSVALRILLLLAVSATPPAHSLRIIAAPLLAISPVRVGFLGGGGRGETSHRG
jgi:hypothetical protein